MKKALLIIMVLAMAFSVAACSGGGNEGGDKQKADAFQTVIDTYKLDMKSVEEQAMSEKRATKDQLSALKHDFFKDTMMFEGTEFENLTYDDIKAQLGIDTSYYYFDNSLVEKQCFVWQADGNDTAKLLISFTDGKLYGLGAANIS